MTRFWLLPATASLLLFAADAPKWLRVKSGNFEVLTTAGEKRAKDTLLEFERVSSFFEQSMGRPVKPDVPLRIVLFKSEKEFHEVRPNEVADAFYLAGPDADYIVMYSGMDHSHVAIHEFVHLLVKHSYQQHLPIWLNEGIAELYATMKPVGNKLQVGGLIPGHMQLFISEKPIPIADVLSATHSSPLYNRKQHAGMFYAESWALAHMLQLSPEYRSGYGKLIEQIERGIDSAAAMQTAYGKPLARIEKDLSAYIRGTSFFGVNFDIKLQAKLDSVESEPASSSDVDVVHAALFAGNGNTVEAGNRLRTALESNPKDPAIAAANAYLQWRQGKHDEARASFQQAFVLGTRSGRVLLDLAKLSSGSNPDMAIKALMRLQELGPLTVENKILLAEVMLRQRMYGAAHAALAGVARVSADDAYRLLRARALALDGLQSTDEAMAAATKAHEFARIPEEKQAAQSLIDYLNRRKQRAQTPAMEVRVAVAALSSPSFVEEEVREGPVVRRKYVDSQGRQVEERVDTTKRSPYGLALREVTGQFVALECRGETAVMIIKPAAGPSIGYLIREPGRLVATNKGQGMEIELTCGFQAPKPVSIFYEDQPDAKTKAAGVVWQIHFQ